MNSYLIQKISYAPFDRIMSSLFNIITVVHRKDPHSPQLQQWQKRKKRQACNFPSMLKAFEEAYSDHLTGTVQNRVQLDRPQSDRSKKRKQTFKARWRSWGLCGAVSQPAVHTITDVNKLYIFWQNDPFANRSRLESLASWWLISNWASESH